MGRVGPLPAAFLEQAGRTGGIQHAAEQPSLGIMLEQSGTELTQDAVIEAGIGKVEGEQVLPVDPRPNGLGGLTVAQTLTELHEGHQSQAPRGVARLASPRVEVGEIALGEDRTDPVPQDDVWRSARKCRVGDLCGLRGYDDP